MVTVQNAKEALENNLLTVLEVRYASESEHAPGAELSAGVHMMTCSPHPAAALLVLLNQSMPLWALSSFATLMTASMVYIALENIA